MAALGRARWLVASALALAAGCAGSTDREESQDRTAAVQQGVVGGTVDTTRPDVLVLQDDTVAGFRCTATLIAPNLVITARHCVGFRVTGTTLCRGDGTDNGAQSLPTYMGDVAAMPMYVASAPAAPLLARGMKVYDDGSTTTCAHDVALIQLDRAIPGITPSQLRRTAPAKGEALVAMGFGWTDRNATINATERMKGTTHVLALGPIVYAFQPLGDDASAPQLVAIAGGEIGVEGITMTGDSGGPAFDAAGQLTALVSRGYSDALYGPGTFTTLAAHLATIDAALIASGNAPIGADGGADAAVPPAGDAAAPSGPVTMPTPPSGGADAAAPAAGETPSNDGSGGCRAAPRASTLDAAHADLAWAGLAALAMAMAAWRRRRGRASSLSARA